MTAASRSLPTGTFTPSRRAAVCGKAQALNNRSAAEDDHFEVFALHRDRAVIGAIEPPDQVHEILLEGCLGRRRECREGLEHRAVIHPEDVEPMLRRAIAKHEGAGCRFAGCRMSVEELREPRPRSP